jgi:hypothetical protein
MQQRQKHRDSFPFETSIASFSKEEIGRKRQPVSPFRSLSFE